MKRFIVLAQRVPSIVGTIGPVVTIILAVNLLGEAFGLPQIIGLLLVLLGVSLLGAKKKSNN